MILVVDLETDGLYDYKNKTRPTVIHCIVVVEYETGKIHKFVGNYDGFKELIDKAEFVVGHNFIAYDRQVINDILKFLIPINKIRDTLVLSRLLNPKGRGHSLAAWGEELGHKKPEHEDWSQFSEEMLHRCTEDTLINVKVYEKLWNEFESLGFSIACLQVESVMVELLRQQEEYGCPLDVEFTRAAYYSCKDQADELEQQISKVFPKLPDKRKSMLTEFIPKFTKDGKLYAKQREKLQSYGFNDEQIDRYWKPSKTIDELDVDTLSKSCTLFRWRSFDIDALSFVKDHLLRLGWHPLEYTENGSPKITEDSLETFAIPEARLLKDYILLRNRERTFSRWLEEVSSDGFVHSWMNSLGTWTHRCSHTNFMGNPPRLVQKEVKTAEFLDENADSIVEDMCEVRRNFEDSETENPTVTLKNLKGGFGYECRMAWAVPKDKEDLAFVGADADQIQLRAFAHYIQDDDYINKVISEDIHTYHKELAELKSRNAAKTFVYMYLLGGGNHKAGVVYDMTPEEMEAMKDRVMSSDNDWIREKVLDYGLDYLKIPRNPTNYALAYRGWLTKRTFEDAIPGLKTFKQEAQQKGAHWFEAIDGRKIKVWSSHKLLAAALQSFEAAIMKRATIIYQRTLTKENIWFKQVNHVHDEWLTLTERVNAEYVGKIMEDSIEQAGIIYGSRCPLKGSHKIGKTWMEVH